MFAELLVITAIALFAIAFYKWATQNNDYFARRNLKFMKPTLFFGNTGGFLLNKYTPIEFSQLFYQSFPDEPISGLFDFRDPQYIIRDLEVIKKIAVKDFDHFEDHQGFADENIDKLWGNSLFLMTGEKWRQMRSTLSPAFTGSKMRIMFELVAECVDEFVNHFLKKVDNDEKINIEMKDAFTKYTNDVIATCAYGLKINSLADPENEFYLNGKKLTDFMSFKQIIKIIIILQAPSIAKALGITLTDPKVAKTFKYTILDTMEIRKKNNIQRPDMINMLMQVREGTLKHQSEEEEKEKGFASVEESEIGKKIVNRAWNDDELVAQCFIFFVGGFETTSSILNFASYELAINQNVQEKLYNEIKEVNEQLGGKRITYDALQKMKYLDQVICETLRKWPPLPQSDRLCVKEYSYDDGNGLKFNVEVGKSMMIPIYGIHHDSKYFSDPEKFDPERFNDENKHKIAPYWIPFGVGPRNCIGNRFAMMVLKAVLYNLLLNFSFEPNDKTQIPLKLKKSPFNFIPEKGIHLELKPRIK